MRCGLAECGHCQLGPLLLCRDGPVVSYDRGRAAARHQGALRCPAPSSRSGSSPPATAASSPCWTARTSCSRWRARSRSRTSPRPSSADVAGPYDVSLVEGSVTTPQDASASGRSASSPGPWSRSARAPPPAASRRCVTSPTSPTSPRPSTPGPSTSQTLATSTPIADHVTVDFELRGCPIDKRQLVELISALLARPQAANSRAQRLLRVQAPRHHLRHGRSRHPVPRPGDPGRVRRHLPGLRPWLLRLLRARRRAEHRLAHPQLRLLGLSATASTGSSRRSTSRRPNSPRPASSRGRQAASRPRRARPAASCPPAGS